MQIRTDIVLQSVIKSLSDVVVPALAPDNRLAQEQMQLIFGLLTLLAQRLPLAYDYDLDELQRLLALASALQELAADAEFAGEIAAATSTANRAALAPDTLRKSVVQLSAAVADRVGELTAEHDDLSRQVGCVVLKAARAQLLRERSWLLMQGWEIDPAAVPPIETLIACNASPT